jgi:hypothetical protein
MKSNLKELYSWWKTRVRFAETGRSRIVRACCLLVALRLPAALRWRLAVESEAFLAGHRAGGCRVQLDVEKKVV